MQAFRRRVLDVTHVKVETAAIEKKSSVSRWFFVVPVVQIDRASIRLSEEIVLNLRWPQLRIDVRFVFTYKAAIFGFDSNDPIHRSQLRTESRFGSVCSVNRSAASMGRARDGCRVRCPHRIIGL